MHIRHNLKKRKITVEEIYMMLFYDHFCADQKTNGLGQTLKAKGKMKHPSPTARHGFELRC